MSRPLSITLGICIAGGSFAAGALLVEPASVPSAQAQAEAQHQTHGQASGRNAPTTPPANASPKLTIADFTIESITVSPGATVTVLNSDTAPHTVTAEDGSFDTGNLAPGASATFVAPTTSGTYRVFCAVHPSMTATLTVA